MAHLVKCRQCGLQFDIEKETDYVQQPKGWYYHLKCFEDKFPDGKPVKVTKTYSPNIKICYYCNKELDITKEEYAKPIPTRYAHKSCMDLHYNADTEYIPLIYTLLKEKVHMAYNYNVCERQRANYIKQGYSNKGIYQALEYWYVIQKNSTEKSNGAIGIVPYVYANAQHYFEDLEKRQNAINRSLKKSLKVKHIKIDIDTPEIEQQRKLIDLDDVFKEEEEEENW